MTRTDRRFVLGLGCACLVIQPGCEITVGSVSLGDGDTSSLGGDDGSSGGDSMTGGGHGGGGDDASGGVSSTGGDSSSVGGSAAGGDSTTSGGQGAGGDNASGGVSSTGGDTSTGGQSGLEPQAVTWIETNEVTVLADGSVTSTTDSSYGSFAHSSQALSGTEGGYFEFTARNMTGLLGLAANPTGGGYMNIDFALQLWTNSEVYVVESGVQKGLHSTWKSGDVFRISVQNGVVSYDKNGETFYVSEQAAKSTDYYVDFAFGLVGTGFDAPVLSGT